ncbi:MAG: histidinol dehydrogenase [Anaerolineae bacterium]|nr:histidinol dehydrogenase [Anaerolineae bacterium]
MLTIYTVTQARETILKRGSFLDQDVSAATKAVQRILHDVRQRGDAALFDWTEQLDGVRLESVAVSAESIHTARNRIPTDLLEALELAAGRIRAFHELQPLPDWTTTELGGVLGQRVTPIRRVGIYVPGGTAPLPSSVLMGAIPAQVAGCPEIVIATPPTRDGTVPDVILAASAIAGVETIYALGGAQAVGALAFGTASVPAVDKIFGPGNLYVTLAKREVYGVVGIDGLYGPTETMVIADDSADVRWVSADLLAQAEHDILASAILLTPSRALAEAVQLEIESQLDDLPDRHAILLQSLTRNSGIIVTTDLDEACALADAFAPEHLCLSVRDPHALAPKISNAGGLFMGERSFEVLGDYVAGPSHTMPTGGTARFSSPLNVADFIKINSIIDLDADTAKHLSQYAARIADSERLYAHRNAARKRL